MISNELRTDIGNAVFLFSSVYALTNALTSKKAQSHVYKVPDDQTRNSTEQAVPIVYGYNRVKGVSIYQEQQQSDAKLYDAAYAFSEGEVYNIDTIYINGIDTYSYGGDTSFTIYTGTPTQAGDSIFEAGTAYIKVKEDAHTLSSQPTVNFGTWSQVYVANEAAYYQYGIVKFDFSGLNPSLTIENAKIWLQQAANADLGASGGYDGLEVYSAHVLDPPESSATWEGIESWAENTITWNNMPSSVTKLGDTDITKTGAHIIKFNDTGVSYLQTAYDNGYTATLILKVSSSNTTVQYLSSETGTKPPALQIEYSGGDPCGFRNTAYAAITLDTETDTFTPNPDVSADVSGVKIYNWNSTLSAYETSYSNNPAWVLYDFMTNQRYGVGISTDDIDIDTFKIIGLHCEDGVTTEDDTEESRYMCDAVIDTQSLAKDIIQDILVTFNGYIYRNEGRLCLGSETVTSSSGTIAASDMREGTFEWGEVEHAVIPNRVRVLYIDKDRDFEKQWVQVDDELDQDERGIVQQDIYMYYINRRTHASRMATFVLQKAKQCRYTCAFTVSINHMNIQVGDVWGVTHDLPDWTGKLFRVVNISETPDDEYRVTCEEYDANIYNDLGIETPIDESTRYPNPYEVPPEITDLALSETYIHNEQNVYISQVYVEWTPPDYVYPLGYMVYLKRGGGSYEYQGEILSNSVTINLSSNDTYYVLVRTRNMNTNVKTSSTESPSDDIAIVGQGTTPAIPALISIGFSSDSQAEWDSGYIYYKGGKYDIVAGDTTDKYIYFDPSIDDDAFLTSSSEPSLTSDGWLVCLYDSSADTVYPVNPTKIFPGDFIADNSISAGKVAFAPGSLIYLGEFSSAPGGPNDNEWYFNTTDGNSYVWYNGSWRQMSEKGDTGATGATGAPGAMGDTGDPGPGFIYRGVFDSGTTYYNTSYRRDAVTYSGTKYLFIGTSGTSGAWNPANWSAAGGTFEFIATDLLLANDVAITRTLTMGDGANDGTIQSYGWDGSADGYQLVGGATPSFSLIGGDMSGSTITGGTIQTDESGNHRLVISSSDNTLRIYNSSDDNVVTIDDGSNFGGNAPLIHLSEDTYGGEVRIARSGASLQMKLLSAPFIDLAESAYGGAFIRATNAVDSSGSAKLFQGVNYNSQEVFYVSDIGELALADDIVLTSGATVDGVDISAHDADVTTKHMPSQSGHSGKYLTTNGSVASWGTGSGGVTDHGALTGLGDDDHTQYLNTTRHSAIGSNPHGVTYSQTGAAASSHSHSVYATDTDLSNHAANASAHHTKTAVSSSPSNGDTTTAISSDWAYDHNVGAGVGKHVPSGGTTQKFLRGDGTWQTVPTTGFSGSRSWVDVQTSDTHSVTIANGLITAWSVT